MAKKTVEDKLVEQTTNRMAFNPLLNALRENDKKNLFVSNAFRFYHPTGFPMFDYYFGSVMNIHNDVGEIVEQIPMVGQADGTFNLIIGITGSGKSTLAIQLASNIIRPFNSSMVVHYDIEQRTDISRCEAVSKLPSADFDDGGRYILKIGQQSLENIQETIVELYVNKMRIKDQITYATGQKNEFGREIKILEPTVIIIDSISTVITDTFSINNEKEIAEAKQLQGNSEGMRTAKGIRGFFRDILPLCKEANIIIYAVNHITDNVQMSMFGGPKKQQNFLKQEEAIPGGKMMLYAPFNIIKLVSKSSDYFEEKTDGFNGHMIMVEPVKSSCNQSGNDSRGVSFELVFDYKNGIDSLHSLIIYGKEKGLIEGNKPRMKFVGDPSFTFAFKELDKEVNEKPIWESIQKFIIPELKTHLSFIEPESIKFDERSLIH